MQKRVDSIETFLTHSAFLELKEKRLIELGTFNAINILDKYSTFLRSQEWDYFSTYTTRRAISLPAARRLMETYAIHLGCGGLTNFTNKTIPGKEFQEPVNVSSTGKAMLFWAAEPFKLRDSFHLHALVKCDMSREQVDTHWQKKYGFARVKKYDSKKPGAEYVSKYMTKELSDYDLHC